MIFSSKKYERKEKRRANLSLYFFSVFGILRDVCDFFFFLFVLREGGFMGRGNEMIHLSVFSLSCFCEGAPSSVFVSSSGGRMVRKRRTREKGRGGRVEESASSSPFSSYPKKKKRFCKTSRLYLRPI